MAEMNKKEFDLIGDAVNEGIAKFFNGLPETDLVRKPAVERRLRLAMSEALAHRLRYTNNSFDSGKFRDSIEGVKLVTAG